MMKFCLVLHQRFITRQLCIAHVCTTSYTMHTALACVSGKVGTGGGGWSHPQGAVHMAAALAGCRGTMDDTRSTNFHPGCMNELGKYHSHLVGVDS